MYAVIENGSKQYKVCEGDVVRVEKLDANVGDTVEFNVVMVSDENGVKVGSVFGDRFGRKAELVGGAILILIGLRILLEHLGFL